jgi:hypothetical protein
VVVVDFGVGFATLFFDLFELLFHVQTVLVGPLESHFKQAQLKEGLLDFRPLVPLGQKAQLLLILRHPAFRPLLPVLQTHPVDILDVSDLNGVVIEINTD